MLTGFEREGGFQLGGYVEPNGHRVIGFGGDGSDRNAMKVLGHGAKSV